eukprot:TRINITY_DN17252_c0_g1_i1.p1 TRINITY_DN17252_c0_g1~~TRINITY_DN17252_c0_g1_i1.p1  ORF type:complete len:114 (+),score=0.60 TRINITY_DN17252_c0_g1_i1:494-835(+)
MQAGVSTPSIAAHASARGSIGPPPTTMHAAAQPTAAAPHPSTDPMPAAQTIPHAPWTIVQPRLFDRSDSSNGISATGVPNRGWNSRTRLATAQKPAKSIVPGSSVFFWAFLPQ